MSWFHIIYFISILISAAVMGFIADYSRRHRDAVGSGTYMWIAFMVSLLALFDGLVMIGPTREWALFWFNLRFLSFAAIPVLWLIFVLQYIGKSHLLTKPRIAMLFIIPVITQVMIWTNGTHGLWVKQTVGFHQAGPFFIVETAARIPGPWMKVHNIFTYFIMIVGVVLLFTMSVRLFRQYRGQAIALGTGTLIMIIGSLFPAFNLIAGREFNPLPQSFALGSLIIAWGIYRYQLLGTAPLFSEEKRMPVILVMLLILLAFGIIFTGYINYQQYEKHFRVEVERQLSSVAELKVSELVQWRRERLGDANLLYDNAAFAALVRRFFLNAGDSDAQWQIRTWLDKLQTSYQYRNILLLDTNGKPRMSVPNKTGYVGGYLLKQATEINRSGKITFLDFHRDAPEKPIYLSVVVPIIDRLTNSRSIGLAIFFIDPATYLYPLINRWPTPSKTAETLLIRREGNDVQYLNELKFRKGTALSLRMPLTNVVIPSVMAALGKEGMVEGLDYRGVPVIAAINAVPDSPWFLVARIDAEEVYAPIKERLWLMIVVVSALLTAAGLSVGLLWRRQSHRFYQEQYKSAEALRASETFLNSIIEHSPHAMWISDERGTLLRLNQACRNLLNITDDEVVGKYNVMEDSIVEKQGFLPLIRKVFEKGETARFTLRYDSADLKSLKLKDTVSLILEVTISPVLDGKRVTNAIIQHVDITERKKAEENIKKLSLQQQALLTAIPDIIMEVDTNKIYTWANEPGIEFFGKDVIGKEADFYFVREQNTYDVVLPIFKGSEDVINLESWQKRKDGQERLLAWWCRVLKDAQGNVTGALSSARDITERKLAEEKITEQLDELLRWHKVTLGREGRIHELKAEVNELLARAGEPPRYPSTESQDKKEK
jgi:PAS domain S-box-containing protein